MCERHEYRTQNKFEIYSVVVVVAPGPVHVNIHYRQATILFILFGCSKCKNIYIKSIQINLFLGSDIGGCC